MGNKQKKPDLMDVAIELKMTAKSMERQSQKLEQQEKAERKKILDALNKGNLDNAKIFAETVIRNRKEALNVKRFGVKMGALATKIESAARTQNISETISKTLPMLQRCMQKMDAMGIGNNIADFEKVFEDLDVKTEEMNGAMDNVYATTIDQSEVTNLLQEMRDAHGMEVGNGMVVGDGAIKGKEGAAQKNNEVDDMQKRLDELKNL